MQPAFGLAIAYVVGSFPSAYLAGRLLKGIDLRTMGSGNLGATNVYRHLGRSAALVVLLLDAAKGALPVYILPRMIRADVTADERLWWALGFGLAAILGHTKPIFLLWKGGGKGVATAAGIFAVLAPMALLASTALCAAVVWWTGYMSAGSVAAALLFPVLIGASHELGSPLFIVSLAISVFIVWAHRANLSRLRAGTEQQVFRRTERLP